MAKMIGRLGWRGQCSCCNGPKPKKAIRAEEHERFDREYVSYLWAKDWDSPEDAVYDLAAA